MFQDIGVSRDLNEQFRHHLDSLARSDSRGRTFDYEFTVQVLSTGAWPFSERTLLNLPVEVSILCSHLSLVHANKDFTMFIHSQR